MRLGGVAKRFCGSGRFGGGANGGEALGDIVECGDGFEHRRRELPIFLLLIEQSQLIANGLSLGALTPRVGEQAVQAARWLSRIVPVL